MLIFFFRIVERKKKAVERLEEQLEKLEIAMTDKDENKEIALGTSKLNYLDPRISVAWYVESSFSADFVSLTVLVLSSIEI